MPGAEKTFNKDVVNRRANESMELADWINFHYRNYV